MINKKNHNLTIKKPIIIVGCPRSGTSLLFRILGTSNQLWSLYRESNDIWNRFYKFAQKEFKDEVLTESDLNNESKEFLINEFHKHSLNNYYLGYFIREYLLKKKWLTKFLVPINNLNIWYKRAFQREYRLVEKTPKNCFRIPFMNKLFEDCKFIFLKRDPRSNINSLIEGWRVKKRYVRGQAINIPVNIKGYNGEHWKYVLPEGWENYTNKSLEEVCAFQWVSSNEAALAGLKLIEDKRKCTVTYEELTENTFEIIRKLCDFIEIPFSEDIQKLCNKLPLVNVVTLPGKDKWRKNIHLIEKTYPMIEPITKELEYELSRSV